LVVWIDRMTDWSGRRVIEGIAAELIDRLPAGAVAGPPRADWGSADAATAAYWKERTAAFHGIVAWSPTIDPENLKLLSQELVVDAGVHPPACRPGPRFRAGVSLHHPGSPVRAPSSALSLTL